MLTDFNGGPSWCFRFMRRKGLSMRTRTTVCQKLPADFRVKKDAFHDFVFAKKNALKIERDHIVNMDEVLLTFDIPMNRTVEAKGSSTVSVTTTGHEKSHFTVVLACTASGKKLPPMIIFKRKTIPKEKFPPGVIVIANEKGWMNTETMLMWLSRCYSKRPDGFFHRQPALLVMDSMRAHLCPDVLAKIKGLNSTPAIIPGGMTKMLQPLDISVNRVFKLHLRNLWETWMCEGEHSFTATGRQRRASYAVVTSWVAEAWQKVTDSVVVAGFVKAELIPGRVDLDLSEINSEEACLTPEIADLFNSDTEDEDFDGFVDTDV